MSTGEMLACEPASVENNPTYIVGIGASAGGLEALERLFETMPTNTGMAFVIVQHLSPDFKSLMEELLSRRTAIPVHRVENGTVVEPDSIYLIPPRLEMSFSEGKLLMAEVDPDQRRTFPIDNFFRSLALSYGRNSVAIVLSGTGSDGSRGIQEIHTAGGLVISQTGRTAMFDGMPGAARETGVVDLSLDPEDIPTVLVQYSVRHDIRDLSVQFETIPADEEGFAAILRLLRDQYGIDFSFYKPNTVVRRTQRRLQLNRIDAVKDYLERLERDPVELNALYHDLLVGVTRFDRHWNIYRKRRDVRLNRETRPSLSTSGRSLRASGLPEYIPPSGRGIDVHIAGSYDALLAEFMPPGLLIDSSNRLLHVFGDAGKYLRHPSGRTNDDVLDCMESSLKLAVIGAIRRTQSTQEPVSLRGVPVGKEILDLAVRLVKNSRSAIADYLITFSTTALPAQPIVAPTEKWIDMLHVSGQEIQALEEELRRAREITQALIEELETSNEELQATYEELVASNEELQSTNEELHSVNEELHTVNAEHQRKIGQLTVLTDDMENLLHSTQVHTLFLDQQLRIRRFTPRMGEIFSLVLHDVGRSIEAFHNRLQYGELLEDLRSVQESGRLHESEIQDHGGRWFLMRILPYMTEKSCEGVVLTLTDIDLTRRAQMNLNRVIDFFPNSVVATNDQGIILIVNQRTQSIFGYEADEMIGQPVEMLLPERLREEHVLKRRNYASNPQPREMEQLENLSGLRKNGEEFPVELGLNSIDTEKSLLILASINDITVRQATQKELVRREQELRLVINSVPMLVAYIDVNRVYRYVNNYYCAKLGLSSDDVRDKRVQCIVGDDVYAQKRQHLDRVFAGESVTAELKRVFPTDAPGHETWIQAHYEPDRDDHGQVRGCFVAMSDITELKELVAAKEWQVEQRDLFMATLSHELRNPLGAVTSGLRLLQSSDENTEQQCKILAAIDRQTSQMTALLDDLLDLSRVTKGKIELRRAPTRLDDVIRESVESVMPLFEKRNQTISVILHPQTVWVDGDAVRLRQIVNNLLTNACRYSPPGDTIAITLDLVSPKCGAIRVKDHGIGIPREMQERIFEPFAQLRRTHNEASEGLGLGLSLSRRLAELHKGTVKVFSEGEGRGSEFTIQMPLIEAPATSLPANPAQLTFKSQTPRSIVLVEDNDDARDLLRQLLEYEFFHVDTAADGISGLDLIRNLRPQVALIDIGLPGMNGHEIAKALRSAGMPTYLIALTGYGQDSDRKAALNAGFNEHVTKPLDFDKVLRLLERITADDKLP